MSFGSLMEDLWLAQESILPYTAGGTELWLCGLSSQNQGLTEGSVSRPPMTEVLRTASFAV